MRKGKYSIGTSKSFGRQRVVKRRRLLPGVKEIHVSPNQTGLIVR